MERPEQEIVLQHSTATQHCNTLHHIATHCNTAKASSKKMHTNVALPCTATHCNTLRHTATHCNTLQHTAPHCNTAKKSNEKLAHSSSE